MLEFIKCVIEDSDQRAHFINSNVMILFISGIEKQNFIVGGGGGGGGLCPPYNIHGEVMSIDTKISRECLFFFVRIPSYQTM